MAPRKGELNFSVWQIPSRTGIRGNYLVRAILSYLKFLLNFDILLETEILKDELLNVLL